MDAGLQNRINPFTSPNSASVGTGKVRSDVEAVDSNANEKTNFKDLLLNSNSDMLRKRAALKNGDDLSAAKTDEEFFEMLSKQTEGKVNRIASKKELDKDAFMKLFITQLQNQDPLNPDDSAKMAAQLAQFQGLEQMTNVNTNLEKMATNQSQDRAIDLVGFVGKEITLSGGRLKLKDGKLTDALFTVDTPIANAYLEVRNGAGVVVAKKPLETLTKGDHDVSWDGKDKAGKPSRDGIYSFAVVGSDENGQEVPVKITSTVKVTGIDMQESGGSFYTELGKVGMHEVDSVGEQGFDRQVRATSKSLESVKDDAEQKEKDLLSAAEKMKKDAVAPIAAGTEGLKPDVVSADEVPQSVRDAAAASMGMSTTKSPVENAGAATESEADSDHDRDERSS